jgi:hypothetical protein
MQQKQSGYDAIIVWNPFVMETLNRRDDVHVLFDSTKIPNEIIDTVAVAQASLDKPGGREFACAVIDTYYAVNQRLAAPATRDDTLVALGEKFSHLDLASMKKVVQQTKFYATPKEGLAVLTGPELREIMKKVVDFCVVHGITTRTPKVGYGGKAEAKEVDLRFDPSYIKLFGEKTKK